MSKIKLDRIKTNFSGGKFFNKVFRGLREMTRFLKVFCPFISKSLHIHFNPSQNVSSILLLNGLVMVTNEGSIACECFKQGSRSNLTYGESYKIIKIQPSLYFQVQILLHLR